jgi:hypothetical protein
MKGLIFMFAAFFSTSLFASEKVVLDCSTDALGYVQIVENQDGKGKLEISYLSDEIKTLNLTSTLKNIIDGKSDTLIATKDNYAIYGGAIENAALLRVFPGQQSARLAVDGVVYILRCSKK